MQQEPWFQKGYRHVAPRRDRLFLTERCVEVKVNVHTIFKKERQRFLHTGIRGYPETEPS